MGAVYPDLCKPNILYNWTSIHPFSLALYRQFKDGNHPTAVFGLREKTWVPRGDPQSTQGGDGNQIHDPLSLQSYETKNIKNKETFELYLLKWHQRSSCVLQSSQSEADRLPHLITEVSTAQDVRHGHADVFSWQRERVRASETQWMFIHSSWINPSFTEIL